MKKLLSICICLCAACLFSLHGFAAELPAGSSDVSNAVLSAASQTSEQDVIPSDDIAIQDEDSTVPPAEEEGTSNPVPDDGSTVSPAEEEGASNPVPDDGNTVPPAEEEDTSNPVPGDGNTVPPAEEEDTSNPVPGDDSAVPPAEEEGASNPAPDDGSAVPPAENAEDENAPLPEQTDTSETGDQPDGMAADDVADEDETEDLDATQDSADTVVPENSLLMGAAQPMAEPVWVWEIRDGGWVCVNASTGELRQGWDGSGSVKYYYKNGVALTGLQRIDNDVYYFDPGNQTVQYGWMYLYDTWRHFDESSGAAVQGWIGPYEAKYFYGDGIPFTGFQKVYDDWFYFDEINQNLQYGWHYVENAWRRFNEVSGSAYSGWNTTGSVTYYYDKGQAVTGMQKIEGDTYYFDEKNQSMQRGWHYVNNAWRRFDETTGKAWQGWSGELGKANCYYYQDGMTLSGLQRVELQLYYFSPANQTVQYGWQEVDGVWRLFDYVNGNAWQGWTAEAGSAVRRYFEDGEEYRGLRWVDGKRYYFLDDGNPTSGVHYVQYGEHLINGMHMTFSTTDGSFVSCWAKGIDVSSHNGLIDWAEVAKSDVTFAIIRGLHWNTQLNDYAIDPYFYYNVINAKAYGIKVGAYIYSYAFSVSEALDEAWRFVSSVEVQQLKADNIKFDFPIYIDYEDPLCWANTSSNAQRTEIVRAAMDGLVNQGYASGLYTSYSMLNTYFNAGELINDGYDLWIADWGSDYQGNKGNRADAPMWQYSDRGTVSGVSGRVDTNYVYVDYPNLLNYESTIVPTPTPQQITVFDQVTNTTVTGNLNDILAQIIEMEVGGFQNAEVYKAQAVATNSYLQYLIAKNKVPSVKLKTASSAARNAVAQVSGQVLTYNGSIALAMYTSSSATVTNSAANYGWGSLPYLTNVDNSWDALVQNRYVNKTCYVTVENLKKGIENLGGSTAAYEDPSTWIEKITLDANGWVTSVVMCGKQYNAEQFYSNTWGLLSTNFKQFSFDAENQCWVFTGVNGNGHGVGMSQYGAYGMSQAGYTYAQILLHYYPGTALV